MDDPTFSSDREALDHYRTLARNLQCDLDDTKSALDDFQISSKELETELETELQATEKQLKDLRGKEEKLLHEIDQWKNKYHSSLRDHTKTMTHMQGELETLRKSNEEYRTRLRDMELDNDELEGKERMVTSSLQDVEAKYGKAIERITLLEDELIEKSRLEEECQRLKDDLRDMAEELAILRDQQANLQASTISMPTPTSQLLTPVSVSSDTPEAPSSEPGMEVLKDPKDLASPLRAMGRGRTAAISTIVSDNSPRRRLTSLSVNSSPSRDLSTIHKSTALNLKKTASLRLKSPLGTARPNLHEVLSPGSRIPPPGNIASNNLSRSAVRRDLHMIHLQNNPNSKSESSSNRRSHLQSLRAETERMQGMTKKLVSSRTLRQGSAIPVPNFKAPSLSYTTSTKSSALANSTQNRSLIGKSPTKKFPSGLTGSTLRHVTQPSTTQDRESEIPQTDLSRRNSKSSQVVSAGIPRARPKPSRPTSRLSMSSDQRLSIPPVPNRSTTPNAGIPRRKASIDCAERFVRPSSTQENHRSHFRRKSAGVNFCLQDEKIKKGFQLMSQSKGLGKSLGPCFKPGSKPTGE